jgi:hypothetical protein
MPAVDNPTSRSPHLPRLVSLCKVNARLSKWSTDFENLYEGEHAIQPVFKAKRLAFQARLQQVPKNSAIVAAEVSG